MIKLPPETPQLLAVGKTIDSRQPCAIMDTPTLTNSTKRKRGPKMKKKDIRLCFMQQNTVEINEREV